MTNSDFPSILRTLFSSSLSCVSPSNLFNNKIINSLKHREGYGIFTQSVDMLHGSSRDGVFQYRSIVPSVSPDMIHVKIDRSLGLTTYQPNLPPNRRGISSSWHNSISAKKVKGTTGDRNAHLKLKKNVSRCRKKPLDQLIYRVVWLSWSFFSR